MDMAMEMTTAATPTATGTTIVQPMERNTNGKRRRKCEAPVTALAPNDRRSCMERIMRQQAQELTQLFRTVKHLTNLLQAQAACEEAQWLGMLTWMQERKENGDAHHVDDRLWGAGIPNMTTKVIKGVVPGQEVREKERDETAGMDGGGLEASQHAHTTQEGGPEERQQLQQQPKPRPPLKLQPNLQHEPRQKSAPTPRRWWETVPPRTLSHSAPICRGGLSTAERRLIFKRGESVPLPGPALTGGLSMADRWLILRMDESIPLP